MTAAAGQTRSPVAWSLAVNAAVPVAVGAAALLGATLAGSFGGGIGRGVDPYVVNLLVLVGLAVVPAVGLQLINGFAGQFSLGHAGFVAVGAYLAAYPSRELSAGLTDPFSVVLFHAALFAAVGVGAALLWAINAGVRATGRLHPTVPSVLLLALGALVLVDLTATRAVIGPAFDGLSRAFQSTLAAGLPTTQAMAGGWPGLLGWLRRPVCFVVLLIGGGLWASAAGVVVGLPTLRLRGDYLAIATLGFAEIIRIGLTNSPPLGGALGFSGIPTYTTLAWAWGAAVLATVLVYRLAYSSRGRLIRAVREDEIAAAAVGIDPARQKLLAFVAGSFLAGVGGGLAAHYNFLVTPADASFVRSVEFVVIVTLGGLGSVSGTVIAAVVLTLLPELLRNADDWLPASVAATGFSLSQSRMVLYALLLIGMMLLRPRGLLGGRELWPRRRRELPDGPAATEDRDDRQAHAGGSAA